MRKPAGQQAQIHRAGMPKALAMRRSIGLHGSVGIAAVGGADQSSDAQDTSNDQKYARACPIRSGLQIPTHSGQVFRIEAGHHSDLKPATPANDNRVGACPASRPAVFGFQLKPSKHQTRPAK
jgi:hypothetical protein